MAAYRVGEVKKNKRRRRIIWLIVLLILLILGFIGYTVVRNYFKPDTTITQAKAVVTKVNYDSKTKHYEETDFTIDLLNTWSVVPRPAGPYQSYTWKSSDQVTDGQEIEIYEDVIPTNFAVNRALIVDSAGDRLTLDGGASDNCANFTKNTAANTHLATGTPAKWLGVTFLCDQQNTERDVIGTSSTDGINTVIMKNQSTGVNHKFFFTYTDYAQSPDYSVFYNALQSFRMQ